MFEHPEALLLLGLLPLWIRWARREAPLRWPVGGLEVFRGTAHGAPARAHRAWPPSLWLGFVAILCGTLAAAAPRTPQPALLLRDDSLSCRLRSGPWPEPGFSVVVAERVWGSGKDAPRPEALIRRAAELAHGHRLTVLSDQPAPLGLPAGVRWLTPPPVRSNAAILSVEPTSGAWRLSWEAWNCRGPFEIRAGDQPLARLTGGRGSLSIQAQAAGTVLKLHVLSGEEETSIADNRWVLPAPPRFYLPQAADPRWEDALHAAWPGCAVSRGAPTTGEKGGHRIRFQGSGALAFSEDPFRELPELEAVALLARKLRPLRAALPRPRPRAECAPPLQPGLWPAREAEDRPAGGQDISLRLAVVGLLSWLLALGARRLGR